MNGFRALAVALCLAGCAATTTTAVTATVSAAQAQLQAAITLYGISKGIAQVAAVADPGLVPVLATVTASLDPLVARAQLALTAAAIDAPSAGTSTGYASGTLASYAAIEALAATITAQANALTLAAAPAIKVVPSGA